LRRAVGGTRFANPRAMTAIPSARFVVPLLIVFWLIVALVAYSL
jgi:hypothetical protein